MWGGLGIVGGGVYEGEIPSYDDMAGKMWLGFLREES